MKVVNWNMTRSCYKRVTSGTEMDDEWGGEIDIVNYTRMFEFTCEIWKGVEI